MDSNPGPLILGSTALPSVPQPLLWTLLLPQTWVYGIASSDYAIINIVKIEQLIELVHHLYCGSMWGPFAPKADWINFEDNCKASRS